MSGLVSDQQLADFERDGAMHLPGALSPPPPPLRS